MPKIFVRLLNKEYCVGPAPAPAQHSTVSTVHATRTVCMDGKNDLLKAVKVSFAVREGMGRLANESGNADRGTNKGTSDSFGSWAGDQRVVEVPLLYEGFIEVKNILHDRTIWFGPSVFKNQSLSFLYI